MEWWMTKGDRIPVGPFSTEVLLRRIGAGLVPRDAFVCEVGGTEWKCIEDIAQFSAALDERHARLATDSDEDIADSDRPTLTNSTREAEDSEQTSVDLSPLRISEPPPRRWLDRFDTDEEKTIEDVIPLPSSEPPTPR
jgi:hypothetical protein